jgi:nitrate/nitrite-specific signal transduction histidine kinase
MHDITGLKNIEEQLRKTRNDLESQVKERTAELEKANEELQRKNHIQGVLNALLNLSMRPCGLDEILDHILEHIVSIPWISLESKGTVFLAEEDSDILAMKSCRELSENQKTLCSRVPFGSVCAAGRHWSKRYSLPTPSTSVMKTATKALLLTAITVFPFCRRIRCWEY